jgi:integrase
MQCELRPIIVATIRKLNSKRFLTEVRKFGANKPKTFDNKTQAMAWATETEQSLNPDGLVQGKTLRDTFTRYQKEITPNKKSQRTEHNRLNKFLRDPLSQMELTALRQLHFDEWIVKSLNTLKSSDVNRDLNLLSAVFEQAKRWRWTTENPIRGIRRPKNPPPRDRRFSQPEIDGILKSLYFDGHAVTEIRHVIAVAFLFALETAMRQGEIWKLEWKDAYLDKRFVRLHETKNGSKRDVPLSNEAGRLLNLLDNKTRSVFDSNQASSGTIFRRCLLMAGIEGLTFHDTRHEALTRLARKLDVLDLARMVGHRDPPRSLMIYYNATAEEIAARLD